MKQRKKGKNDIIHRGVKMCIIEEMKKSAETVEYQGYYYNFAHIIEILILGLLCRLQTMKDIHYWTQSRPKSKKCHIHIRNTAFFVR